MGQLSSLSISIFFCLTLTSSFLCVGSSFPHWSAASSSLPSFFLSVPHYHSFFLILTIPPFLSIITSSLPFLGSSIAHYLSASSHYIIFFLSLAPMPILSSLPFNFLPFLLSPMLLLPHSFLVNLHCSSSHLPTHLFLFPSSPSSFPFS